MVDQDLYDLIDARETSIYDRSEDLRDLFSKTLDTDVPLYTYEASDLGFSNHTLGKESNIAVPLSYYKIVEDAFRSRGPEALEDYHRYTLEPKEEFEDLILFRS